MHYYTVIRFCFKINIDCYTQSTPKTDFSEICIEWLLWLSCFQVPSRKLVSINKCVTWSKFPPLESYFWVPSSKNWECFKMNLTDLLEILILKYLKNNEGSINWQKFTTNLLSLPKIVKKRMCFRKHFTNLLQILMVKRYTTIKAVLYDENFETNLLYLPVNMYIDSTTSTNLRAESGHIKWPHESQN